jgi:hypothetical protein
MADLLSGRKLYLSFILNSILLVRFIKIGLTLCNFHPHEGESVAQAWASLKLLMHKCPIHDLPHNIIINNFYARLSGYYKDYLDACFDGSFTSKDVDTK